MLTRRRSAILLWIATLIWRVGHDWKKSAWEDENEKGVK